MADDYHIDTDDYDLYGQGDTPQAQPGSPVLDDNGHIVQDEYFFPLSTTPNSMMDQDPNNTGPTNDFWTDYPISIDINGYIFYNGENTGINVRGPQGISVVRFEDLTPEQRESLKGTNGTNGFNGANGINGTNGSNGLSAYEVWLDENGWLDHPEEHPTSEFYQMLANIENLLIKEGQGTGSLLINYNGNYNTANGAGALASGFHTVANGNYSFTSGMYTIAGYDNQTVFGYYNNNKPTSVFEIGNGTSQSPNNLLELDNLGSLLVQGNVTDGFGNVLNNKVDKITGKQLSTNDFNNTYKAFLDNYAIDDHLDLQSDNPVKNSVVAAAISAISTTNGKPTQSKTIANENLGLFHPYTLTDGITTFIKYTDGLQWNPYTNNLKNKNNISSNNYNLLFGENLTATNDYQTVFGKNNNSITNDLFEIGNGTTMVPANAFRVTSAGNVIASGDIIDGYNNRLSDKQDLLTYDIEPTINSNNLVKSGDLYTYLVNHGLDPEHGFTVPEVAVLRAQVAALTNQVQLLAAAVTALGNPREIIDDTYTYNTYVYGIDKDEFYIKLKPNEQQSGGGND